MQEWLNWPLSKSGKPQGFEGSNPSLSATKEVMTKKEETAQSQEISTLAVVSLVLGIVSLTGPGLLLGIPAIITGAIALKKGHSGRGLSLTGLITGIVSTVLSLLFVVLVVFVMLWSMAHPDEYEKFQRDVDQPRQQVESSQT